jgi:FAD synthetase
MAKGKVLVAGTFDFLHPGHVSFLSQAKKHGGFLVVVVSRDSNARKFKKVRPYFSQKGRLALVSSLAVVDRAVLGEPGADHLAVVRKERPDAIVLGYDQWPDEKRLRRALDKAGLEKTKIFRARASRPEEYKSSKIRRHFESA